MSYELPRLNQDSAHDAIAAVDVSERQQVELQLLSRVRRALSENLTLDEIYRKVVDELFEAFGYEFVAVYALVDGALHLRARYGEGAILDVIRLDQGVIGRVARTRVPALIEDIRGDADFIGTRDIAGTEACVPFFRGDDIGGVVNVESRRGRPLGRADLRLIIEIGGYLSLAVERADLEAAVRESEQRLSFALKAAKVGTWYREPITERVVWSDYMWDLYDLPRDMPTPSGTAWEQFVHPDDVEQLRTNIRETLKERTEYHSEFRIVTPKGEVRWMASQGRVASRDAEGRPSALTGITMDITDRKRFEEERLQLAQTEASRRESERGRLLLEETLDRLTDAFIAVDHDWRLTYVNSRAASIFGGERDTMLGEGLWTAIPDLDGGRFAYMARLAESEKIAQRFDILLERSGRWLDVHMYPGEDGLTIYLTDITETRRADARFRSLIQHAHDAIVIVDAAGKLLFASPAFVEILGYPTETMIGQSIFALLNPDDLPTALQGFQNALREGEVDSAELRLRHQDGGWRWIEVTVSNLLDEPSIGGLVLNGRDVTLRKEAEFRLSFLAEISQVIGASLDVRETIDTIARLVARDLGDFCVVDLVDEHGELEAFAVVHNDPELNESFAEMRRRFGLNPNAPIGPGKAFRLGTTVVHQHLRDEIAVLPAEARANYESLFRYGFESGAAVPLRVHGEVIGVLSVSAGTRGRYGPRDVELLEDVALRAASAIENARLYRETRDALAARDRFLSFAAHELRTPITSISGYSTMLKRELGGNANPERVERYQHRLREGIDRLTLLVDDMLDVSRIRLGQLPLRIEEVDLVATIEAAIEGIDESAISDRITIRSELPSRMCPIGADPDRLQQVLANLLDNAIKYSPHGGEIVVSLGPNDGGCEISIRDQGIGIPPDQLERVFDPFGRAANAEGISLPGLGIGLYICRNIIERHGGTIIAESAGENAGTTMRVWLPMRPPQD